MSVHQRARGGEKTSTFLVNPRRKPNWSNSSWVVRPFGNAKVYLAGRQRADEWRRQGGALPAFAARGGAGRRGHSSAHAGTPHDVRRPAARSPAPARRPPPRPLALSRSSRGVGQADIDWSRRPGERESWAARPLLVVDGLLENMGY
jgi:hypothetical protein